MKTRYYLPMFYEEEFQKLKDSKQDFERHKTTYTRRLKTKGLDMFFTPEGRSDDRVLSLVNKVRNDAKSYLEKNNTNVVDSRIFFVDMFSIPKESEVITKIDVTSAYWKDALLRGIITEETNEYMGNMTKPAYDYINQQMIEVPYTAKELKGIRLKSLGSLATRKEIEIYEKGESVHWEVVEQPTKPIYMSICRSIDQMLRKCRLEVEGCIFYYWDCMFVKKGFSKDVIDFFQSKGFQCKSEETHLSYDVIGTKGYLTSEVDGKMYLVSSDNRNLLKSI